MIGGGFINDMRKTMERNRALLQRKSLKEKYDDFSSNSGFGKDWTYKKASKELLLEIRDNQVKRRKRSAIKSGFMLAFITALFAIGMWKVANSKIEAPIPKPVEKPD